MQQKSLTLLHALAACLPGDRELQEQDRFFRILSREDYRRLMTNARYQKALRPVCGRQALRAMPPAQLDGFLQTLPYIAGFLDALQDALQTGCAPSLAPSDRPTFCDAQALRELRRRIERAKEQKNVTNIAREDCMKIFDPATERHLGDQFNQLPAECTSVPDIAGQIEQLFPGTPYCIAESEIAARERAYQESLASLGDAMELDKDRSFRRTMLCALSTVPLLLLPWAIGKVSGMMTAMFSVIATVIMAVAAALLLWKEKVL